MEEGRERREGEGEGYWFVVDFSLIVSGIEYDKTRLIYA